VKNSKEKIEKIFLSKRKHYSRNTHRSDTMEMTKILRSKLAMQALRKLWYQSDIYVILDRLLVPGDD